MSTPNVTVGEQRSGRRLSSQRGLILSGSGAALVSAPPEYPIAEWLSHPSGVTDKPFGLLAQALWAAEQVQVNPQFHTLVRLLREAVTAWPLLGALGPMVLNATSQPTPRYLAGGIGQYGWNANEHGRPRLILAPVLDSGNIWYQRVVVPGAPKTASLDTGVRAIYNDEGAPFYSGGAIAGDGVVLGARGYLYYGSFGTPPSIDYALVPNNDRDGYQLTASPFSTDPLFSGFTRGPAYYYDPVYRDVFFPGDPPAPGEYRNVVVARRLNRVAAPGGDSGGPDATRIYGYPLTPDDPMQMTPGAGPPQGGPDNYPFTQQTHIFDYNGHDLGPAYAEGWDQQSSVSASLQASSILNWGPPAIGPQDVSVQINPSDELLGPFAAFQNPGDGVFVAQFGTYPYDLFTAPSFAQVVAKTPAAVAGSPLRAFIAEVIRLALEYLTLPHAPGEQRFGRH